MGFWRARSSELAYIQFFHSSVYQKIGMITRSKAREFQKSNCQKLNVNDCHLKKSTFGACPPASQDFGIPLVNTGRMEDQLFADCITFQSSDDMDIEGLTYQKISQDPNLQSYLQKLRANLPGYFNMTPMQKSWYFRQVDHKYCQELINGQKSSQKTISLRNPDQITNSNNQQPKSQFKRGVTFSNQQSFVGKCSIKKKTRKKYREHANTWVDSRDDHRGKT